MKSDPSVLVSLYIGIWMDNSQNYAKVSNILELTVDLHSINLFIFIMLAMHTLCTKKDMCLHQ